MLLPTSKVCNTARHVSTATHCAVQCDMLCVSSRTLSRTAVQEMAWQHCDAEQVPRDRDMLWYHVSDSVEHLDPMLGAGKPLQKESSCCRRSTFRFFSYVMLLSCVKLLLRRLVSIHTKRFSCLDSATLVFIHDLHLLSGPYTGSVRLFSDT